MWHVESEELLNLIRMKAKDRAQKRILQSSGSSAREDSPGNNREKIVNIYTDGGDVHLEKGINGNGKNGNGKH